MTSVIRSLSIAIVVGALMSPLASLGAQSAPPPPKRDSAPPLLPPPPSAPRPELVAPRTRSAAQVTPAGESARPAAVAPKQVSAPVDSVRPAPMAAPRAPAAIVPDAPPPPPTRQSTMRAVETAPSPDGPPPNGATARCKDGTYLFTPAADDSCRDRGGLVVIFTPRPAPPTPPRRP